MSQYKRLTIPSITKETAVHKAGLFSKARPGLQGFEEDQITLDLPVTSFEHQSIRLGDTRSLIEVIESIEFLERQTTLGMPAMPYENEWTHQERRTISDKMTTFTLPALPSTPRPAQSNGNDANDQAAISPDAARFETNPLLRAIVYAVIARGTTHTAWESLVVSGGQPQGKATSRWAFFLELPHLLVYIIGAVAITGLYLLIPLLNLLNAVVPGHVNTLLIALGIIVPGELLVCFVLARTLPRGRGKKGSSVAEP